MNTSINTAIIVGIFCVFIIYFLKTILGHAEKIELDKSGKEKDIMNQQKLYSRIENYVGYHPVGVPYGKVLLDLCEAIIDDYERIKK